MDTIAERISFCIESLGLKRNEFAKKLDLSSPFVSELCSGRKIPSDRTISAIVREFGVNEVWLRTGVGSMYQPRSREDEMSALFKSLMRDRPEGFRSRLITALLRFDPEGPEWALLEKIYDSVAAEAEEAKKESES